MTPSTKTKAHKRETEQTLSEKISSEQANDMENDPVKKFQSRLRHLVMHPDAPVTEWENALFAVIHAKEPTSDLARILTAMPFRHDLIDKLDVMNVMANLGYFSQTTRGSLKEMDDRLFPCILEPLHRWQDIYVIYQRTEGGWQAYNASKGRFEEIKDGSRIAKRTVRFTLFEAYDDSKHELSSFFRTVTGHSWFSAILSRFKGTFGQIFVIGFILNLFAVLPPIFIMVIYDRVLSSGAVDTLFMLALGMGLAIATEWILRSLRSKSLSWLSARLDYIVGNKIFAHLINLTPKHIENASLTGQVARVRTFESARDFFSGGTFLSLIDIPFTIISLLIIYVIAGPVALVPLAAAGVLLFCFLILRRIQVLLINKSARASTIRQQFVLETLDRLTTIKSSGMLDLWFQKFRQLSGRDVSSGFRMQWMGSVAETLTQAISVIALVLLIGAGTYLIWDGTVTTGALVASMILIWRVLGPFQSLCLSIPRLEQFRKSVNQLNQIMDLETEEMAARQVSKLPSIRGAIEFEDVRMRYDQRSDIVFKDLSFSLEAGQALAITGAAGTGKSTIFKILQGMYSLESGAIRIDGFDIRQIAVHDIRKHISYIPQHHDFFEGSLIENIRIANPLATRQQIEEALELTGAMEEVDALPYSLDTNIQTLNQEYMSPSFAFKVALARMHVQEAPIVLIDELPNNFQEGDIGDLLYKSIDRLRGKKTLMFVTFRLDYLALSDYILTLNRDKSFKLEPVDVLFGL